MGVAARLETAAVTVIPGAEAVTQLRVRNTGRIVDEVSIDVLGDARPWSVADPPVLSLLPGAEGTARITFRPPRSPFVTAGPIPFGVRARSHEDPPGSMVEEGRVHVEPYFEAAADLSPRTMRDRAAATYKVIVENTGNSLIEAVVTAGDPQDSLDFEVHPPVWQIGPGSGSAAELVVRPRQRFWMGQPRNHAFRVTVETPGAPEVVLDGAFTQEAQLPPWAERLVPTLVAIAKGFLRSLPVLVFVLILVPLALRLVMQLANLPGREPIGGPLGAYTDVFIGPFDVPVPAALLSFKGLDWTLLEASTAWQVFLALLAWVLVWLVLAALSRLVRR